MKTIRNSKDLFVYSLKKKRKYIQVIKQNSSCKTLILTYFDALKYATKNFKKYQKKKELIVVNHWNLKNNNKDKKINKTQVAKFWL